MSNLDLYRSVMIVLIGRRRCPSTKMETLSSFLDPDSLYFGEVRVVGGTGNPELPRCRHY